MLLKHDAEVEAEITDAEDCVYTAKGRLKSCCREEVGTAIPSCMALVDCSLEPIAARYSPIS